MTTPARRDASSSTVGIGDNVSGYIPALNQIDAERDYIRCVSNFVRKQPVVNEYYDRIGNPGWGLNLFTGATAALVAYLPDKFVFSKRWLPPARVFTATSLFTATAAFMHKFVFVSNSVRVFVEEAPDAMRLPMRTVLGDVSYHCYKAVDLAGVWPDLTNFAEVYSHRIPVQWREFSPLKRGNPLAGPVDSPDATNYWLDTADEATPFNFLKRAGDRKRYQFELAGLDRSKDYYRGQEDFQIQFAQEQNERFRRYARDARARLAGLPTELELKEKLQHSLGSKTAVEVRRKIAAERAAKKEEYVNERAEAARIAALAATNDRMSASAAAAAARGNDDGYVTPEESVAVRLMTRVTDAIGVAPPKIKRASFDPANEDPGERAARLERRKAEMELQMRADPKYQELFGEKTEKMLADYKASWGFKGDKDGGSSIPRSAPGLSIREAAGMGPAAGEDEPNGVMDILSRDVYDEKGEALRPYSFSEYRALRESGLKPTVAPLLGEEGQLALSRARAQKERMDRLQAMAREMGGEIDPATGRPVLPGRGSQEERAAAARLMSARSEATAARARTRGDGPGGRGSAGAGAGMGMGAFNDTGAGAGTGSVAGEGLTRHGGAGSEPLFGDDDDDYFNINGGANSGNSTRGASSLGASSGPGPSQQQQQQQQQQPKQQQQQNESGKRGGWW